jgi:hypothetical protein
MLFEKMYKTAGCMLCFIHCIKKMLFYTWYKIFCFFICCVKHDVLYLV